MIRERGFFDAIVRQPETLQEVLENYLISPDRLRNLANLARDLGTTSAALKKFMANDDNEKRFPEAHYLLGQAINAIEGELTDMGLTEKTNASFTKFVLGVHHGLEAQAQAQAATINQQNNYTFIWQETPQALVAKREIEQKCLDQIRTKQIENESDIIDVVYTPSSPSPEPLPVPVSKPKSILEDL